MSFQLILRRRAITSIKNLSDYNLYSSFSRSPLSSSSSSSSVNSDEIDKFSAIGNKWWDTSSADGASPLHTMNPVRVKFIRDCLSNNLSNKDVFASQQLKNLNILDVGCGGGLLSESLARLGASVTAIDPSAKNIEVARAHSRKDPLTSTIDFRQTTIGTILCFLLLYVIIKLVVCLYV